MGNLRVLYMEDDRGLGRLVQRRLERLGYAVELAEDGEIGLARLGESRFDVVLIDFHMPGRDGVSVLEALRRTHPALPAIMMTGAGDERIAVAAMKAGAADYIVKETGAGYIEFLPGHIEKVVERVRLLEAKEAAERALAAQTALLQATLASIDEGLSAFDAAGGLATANENFARLYALPPALLQPGTPLDGILRFCHDRGDFGALPLDGVRALYAPCPATFQVAYCSDRFLEVRQRPLAGGGVVATHLDVTAQKAAVEQLRRFATTDALTGLHNRRNFIALGEMAVAQARRYHHPLSCLMVDADHFKKINDGYGHPAGDAVLVSLAQILKRELREVDVVGRLGGEEFAVILPETPVDAALDSAERLRAILAAAIVTHDGRALRFTVSIGVGCLAATMDFAGLLAAADRSLYLAKHSGRNRIALAP